MTRSPRRIKWVPVIALALLLAIFIFAFQPLITTHCWLADTPRTQLRFSSEMRGPIRTLFKDWNAPGDLQIESVSALTKLIESELPRGSTIEDLENHIRKHFRSDVEVIDWTWARTDSEGVYTFPWLDVKIVKACWNPRDFLEGGSVKVHYVFLEDIYLRTEIMFIGWKGHGDSRAIKIVAVEEPIGGEQQ